MEGLASYDNAMNLLHTVQKSVLFKFFDVMISILMPQDIREVAMFMVDKNIQIKELSNLIKSLFYETSVKVFVENDCAESLWKMNRLYVREKKKAKLKRSLCACCNRKLDFNSMITNRCSHAVSVFCAAGRSACPWSYSCPRCSDRAKLSNHSSSRCSP